MQGSRLLPRWRTCTSNGHLHGIYNFSQPSCDSRLYRRVHRFCLTLCAGAGITCWQHKCKLHLPCQHPSWPCSGRLKCHSACLGENDSVIKRDAICGLEAMPPCPESVCTMTQTSGSKTHKFTKRTPSDRGLSTQNHRPILNLCRHHTNVEWPFRSRKSSICLQIGAIGFILCLLCSF